MDFGAFLDFKLAWENRASSAGLAYFMPVLDLKGRGYLTQVCSNYQMDYGAFCISRYPERSVPPQWAWPTVCLC